MRQFVYSILDLSNRIWPQMLDIDCPVQQYLKPLARNVGLPEELNYVLIPAGSNQPLDGRYTLAQMSIPVGAQLFLRPVQDGLMKQLLDKLYDQVKDEIKDQLLDRARAKLRQIFDLDPLYPDPLHLKEQAWGQPVQTQYQPQYQQQQQYQQQAFHPPLKKGVRPIWIVLGILGGGAVLIGGGIAVIVLVLGLLNSSADRPTNRNEPVLGTGDVQVTLRWNAPVDLDLHVVDPAGQEIWFVTPTSSTGGTLDVDANGNCGVMVPSPVENVFWPTGGAPSGGYQVSVVYYMDCGYSGPVDYEVTIRQNNQVASVLNGTIRRVNDIQQVTSFTR